MGCSVSFHLPDQVVVEESRGGRHRCSISGVRFYVIEQESYRQQMEDGLDPDGNPRVVFGPSEVWVIEQACAVYTPGNLLRWVESISRIKRAMGGRLEVLKPADMPSDDVEVDLR